MSNWEDALATPQASSSGGWEDALAPSKPRSKPAGGIPANFGYVSAKDVDAMPGRTEYERLQAYFAAGGAGHSISPQRPDPIGGDRGMSPGNPGPAQPMQQAKSAPLQSPLIDLARNVGGSIIGPVAGGLSGLAALPFVGSAGAADISQDVQSRLSYTPQAGTPGATAVEAFNSPYNPLTWIPRGAAALGEVAGDALTSAGMPGAGAVVNGAIQAAPMALGLPKVAGSVGRGLATVGESLTPSRPLPVEARVEPTLPQPAPKTIYVMRDGKIKPKEAVTVTAGTPEAAAVAPAPAMAPIMGETRPTVATPGGAVAAAPAVAALTPADVTARNSVLSRVMPGVPVRKSAVTGDAVAAAADFETAKSARAGDAGGTLLHDTIQGERTALQKFAQDTIDATGGTAGTGQAELVARGKTIATPMDALRTHFDGQVRNLYKAAEQKAGSLPSTQLDNFGTLMGKESAFAGKAENQSLGNGIRAYLREQGIMDKNGVARPITVTEAEGVRQYINSQYSHQTSGLIGKVLEALDTDVAKAAGEDVYGAARSMFKEKKRTLDDPKGISRLFDTDPRTPINRSTAYQDIPQKLASLDPDQLAHVTKTLRSLPPDLQPLGQQAMAEVRAHYVNRINEIGNSTASMWNHKGVSNFMKQHSQALADVFAEQPQTLQRLRDLDQAGQILKIDRTYGGADVQKRTLLSRGLETAGDAARRYVPNALGSVTPIPGASIAGQMAGERWVNAAKGKRSLKDAESRVQTLGDVGK